MKLLVHILCLCLALALAWAHHLGNGGHRSAAHDRCEGLEMDAVAVNEEGIPYFFNGDHLFKGFHGKAELSNESFSELDDHHHLGHVDAAFRMHYEDSPSDHDHMFFFLDHKVFSYYQHKLEDGYPKNISEVFPGIPDHLDAAVECPKPECDEDSVIFFKKDNIYHYNVKTKAVDEKEFSSMPKCTSAFRFMEHYYCFHGHLFSKFDPKTGEVHGRYPKEARDYFMRCSNFSAESDHVERERCSRVHLDAITSDNAGNMYAFRGHHFLRKDEGNDTLKADTIENAFKELHSEVDAVFSYENHLYMIKDDQIFVYKVGEPHTHLDGYPKPLKEELGIEGPIDTAFVCESHHVAHIIKGQNIYEVDLKASPRSVINEHQISLFKKVDAAMCNSGGVKVIVGNHFYHFDSPILLVAGKALPEQHKVSLWLFGCDH
uniref:Hemopexin n=1 Tax=Oplegnathus fasciatus TaxID=163134 RepID=H9CCI6_OPLFA|nr:warm-temperature-acclimation-related 65-kDa protein [Oplegnathus fasciatus]AFE88227.1 warm-temperature-acclimation-related 65-kDa protein [Oplegnathus fasciatus]